MLHFKEGKCNISIYVKACQYTTILFTSKQVNTTFLFMCQGMSIKLIYLQDPTFLGCPDASQLCQRLCSSSPGDCPKYSQ